MSSSKGARSSATPFTNPPVLVAFTLAAVGGFFLCFGLVYLLKYCFNNIRRCWTFHRAADSLVRRSSINASSPYRGLPPSLLQSFPTFLYSSVKHLRSENLECAICLVEFGEDSMMRMLTPCYHVFHKICIDHWLCSNKTCPVCRTDLDSPNANHEMRKSSSHEVCGENADERRDIGGGDVCIEIEGDDHGNQRHDDHDCNGKKCFVKSHSTGHAVTIKGDDKYTLRLPENVAFKVIKGKHGYTKSCFG